MFFKGTSTPSSGRIVIIGAGEVGFHTARRLAEEHRQVIVIDHDEEQLRNIQEALDVQTLEGFGASPQVLRDAEIDKAELVLAVTNSDEVNIMACMFAKEMAPHATRVARVRNPECATPTIIFFRAFWKRILKSACWSTLKRKSSIPFPASSPCPAPWSITNSPTAASA